MPGDRFADHTRRRFVGVYRCGLGFMRGHCDAFDAALVRFPAMPTPDPLDYATPGRLDRRPKKWISILMVLILLLIFFLLISPLLLIFLVSPWH